MKLPIPLTVVVVSLAACSGSSSKTTTGKRVTFGTRLSADPETSSGFTTSSQWKVKLTKAALATGALYYFDGEPAFVMRSSGRKMGDRLASLFGIGTAYAHPGHYIAGNALGQQLSPSSADLFSLPQDLPAGDGVTGTYRSARFSFAAPSAGPALAALGDSIAVAEGSAEKGGEVVYFTVSADFADVAKSVTDGQVDGCVFDEASVLGSGTVTLTIKPHVWFNLVDFKGVAPGTNAAPTTIRKGETPQIAFALGLVQLTAYHFAYSPQ